MRTGRRRSNWWRSGRMDPARRAARTAATRAQDGPTPPRRSSSNLRRPKKDISSCPPVWLAAGHRFGATSKWNTRRLAPLTSFDVHSRSLVRNSTPRRASSFREPSASDPSSDPEGCIDPDETHDLFQPRRQGRRRELADRIRRDLVVSLHCQRRPETSSIERWWAHVLGAARIHPHTL